MNLDYYCSKCDDFFEEEICPTCETENKLLDDFIVQTPTDLRNPLEYVGNKVFDIKSLHCESCGKSVPKLQEMCPRCNGYIVGYTATSRPHSSGMQIGTIKKLMRVKTRG